MGVAHRMSRPVEDLSLAYDSMLAANHSLSVGMVTVRFALVCRMYPNRTLSIDFDMDFDFDNVMW